MDIFTEGELNEMIVLFLFLWLLGEIVRKDDSALENVNWAYRLDLRAFAKGGRALLKAPLLWERSEIQRRKMDRQEHLELNVRWKRFLFVFGLNYMSLIMSSNASNG